MKSSPLDSLRGHNPDGKPLLQTQMLSICIIAIIVLLRKKFTKFASVQATTHGFSLCQVNHDLAFVDDSTDDDQNGDLRTQKLDYKSSYSRMKNFITSSFVVSWPPKLVVVAAVAASLAPHDSITSRRW